MLACRNVEVAWGLDLWVKAIDLWAKGGSHGECVNDDMKLLSLQPQWAVFRDMWRVKVMPDYASLRHKFRVSTGRRQI